MIPAAFDYVRPTSVSEALSALGNGANVKLLAGGQSLLPLLKLRLPRPARWSTSAGCPSCAASAHSRTVVSPSVPPPPTPICSIARDAAGAGRGRAADIADRQTRYRGTIGGAIAHADPTSDMAPLLLALDASSSRVQRRVSGRSRSARSFVGPFETALRGDEILTEIRLPAPKGDYGSAYRVIEQRASGYALVGVAAVLRSSGGIDDVRVAITGVGDHPYRATAVEQALNGTDGGDAAIAEAARHATDGQTVSADIHADAEYRAAMAEVYVRRAVAAAMARGG